MSAREAPTGRPTSEAAEKGFTDLAKRLERQKAPLPRFVAASAFAPPRYFCGGYFESVAEQYVLDYLGRDSAARRVILDKEPGSELALEVEVRREKLTNWETVRVVAKVQIVVQGEWTS